MLAMRDGDAETASAIELTAVFTMPPTPLVNSRRAGIPWPVSRVYLTIKPVLPPPGLSPFHSHGRLDTAWPRNYQIQHALLLELISICHKHAVN